MTSYQMTVTSPGGSLVFPITPEFFPTLAFTWKRDGKEVAVTDRVPVHGWFSENDTTVLLSKWASLRAIALGGGFSSFEFKDLDTSTVVYSFSKARIANLESVNQGGGFVNHVEFRFDIEEERGVTFPSLVDVQHEDEEVREVDENGVVKETLRRRVLATGAFGKTDPARAFVLALEPAGNVRSRRIRTTFFDGTVEGSWDVDKTNENKDLSGIRSWEERASLIPALRSSRWYRRGGGAMPIGPVPIRGGLGNGALRVSGTIEAYSEAALPTVFTILDFWMQDAQAAADTGFFVSDADWGAVYPVEFDTDEPTKVTVFGITYSFTIEFGISQEDFHVRPRPVRHVGNQG